jgi:alpha-amylase
MHRIWILAAVLGTLAASACARPTPLPSPTATTAAPVTSADRPAGQPTPDRRPVISTPAWFNEATLYQIFVRSFYDSNGDGIGDLEGVRQKLDYIQSLGIDTIWLNPHYPSLTYHGYDVVDYKAVNPEFGTLDDFKRLLAEMKQRGMRLIVDFVANHASRGHPFFQDAYGNPQSPYTKWFNFKDANNLLYASFFGAADLPEWDHANPAVNAYLIDAALFWLSLGVDGLRADYARGVEYWFWRELRAKVKAQHPEAVLLGEVWDGEPSVLRGYFEEGFEALFDFPWYLRLSGGESAVGKGVLNGAVAPVLLQPAYRAMLDLYPRGAQLVRFASNHDTNRLASAVSGDIRRMRLAAALTMLSPGIPIVYYGEEIGMRGVKGPGPIYDEFRREPMDWYTGERGPGMTTWFKPANRNNRPMDGVSVEEQELNPSSLLNYYRELGRLRREHPALRSAHFRLMERVEACDTCLGFWRWSDTELVAIVFNLNDKVEVPHLDPSSAPVAFQEPRRALHGRPKGEEGNYAILPLDYALVLWSR